ncbi:MAG: nitrite reductase (NAD(P)H) small subunit [Alphaproteobacteria bacterium]|nr:nitrite reductase (NAD(P)H) small subunit [Alphaproteobacteria bacterium]
MPGQHWIEVGRLDDIPRRGARRINRLDGSPPIAIFRTADDEIFGLIDRCPHRGGPLSEGIVQGRSVACPLHGWVIELDSGIAEPPDEGCTRSVAVRLEGNRVLLSAAGFEPAAVVHWAAA